jgi:hypothetical protein
MSLAKREVSAAVAADVKLLCHSAKRWLVCERIISEIEKR